MENVGAPKHLCLGLEHNSWIMCEVVLVSPKTEIGFLCPSPEKETSLGGFNQKKIILDCAGLWALKLSCFWLGKWCLCHTCPRCVLGGKKYSQVCVGGEKIFPGVCGGKKKIFSRGVREEK